MGSDQAFAGRAPIALLVSDVDGTLVTPDKALTPRAIAAVERLRAAGIAFAITSSRPPAGLAYLVAPLGLTTPIAGFNGGMVVDQTGRVLSELTLPEAAARATIEALRQAGADIWVFQGNDWLLTDPHGAYVAHEQMTIRYAPRVVGDFCAVLDGATKIVGSSRETERLKAAEASLRGCLDGHAAISMSQSYYLDITHQDAHKGTAVLTLSRLLGIPTARIATIGDMENDVRMFEVAGFSIAMGNATPEVKARATAVTATNEEDGFAVAVERYILPQ